MKQRWIGCHFFLAGGIRRIFRFHFAPECRINYIQGQENRLRRKSFQQEYVEFLKRHHIAYDQRFVFKPV